MRWKTIVVGYNGFDDHRPLPKALGALASLNRARVVLTHVVPEPPPSFSLAAPLGSDELYARFVGARTKKLQELARTFDVPHAYADAFVRTGSPDIELIRVAREVDADLIVVQDETQRRREGLGFATITNKLFRASEVPVLALRGDREWRSERVLASVDVDPWKEANEPLNRRIVEEAARCAAAMGAGLAVVHACSLWGEQLMRSRGHASADELDGLRRHEERERMSRLRALVGACETHGVETEFHLDWGDLRLVLPKFEWSLGAELIVMGTVARTGLAGFFIGNTAERVINSLRGSLLTVKPFDFVSPVFADASRRN